MDAIMTTAPCGCSRHVEADAHWVGHTEDCRAKQAKAHEAAEARDIKMRMDKQATQKMLAELNPSDLERLIAMAKKGGK